METLIHEYCVTDCFGEHIIIEHNEEMSYNTIIDIAREVLEDEVIEVQYRRKFYNVSGRLIETSEVVSL